MMRCLIAEKSALSFDYLLMAMGVLLGHCAIMSGLPSARSISQPIAGNHVLTGRSVAACKRPSAM